MRQKHPVRWKRTMLLFVVLLNLSFFGSASAQSNADEKGFLIFLPLVAGLDDGTTTTDNFENEHSYILVEGDILIPAELYSAFANRPESTFTPQLWPNGIVNFEFNANVTTANRTLMLAAMTEWENVATVDFRQCNNNLCSGNHVHIRSDSGNNSFVGMIGGEQVINIFNWNFRFIMAHELAHTLGYWHEQSRTDRGTYVDIRLENIIDDDEHNFNPVSAPSTHYGPYDFDSVMHYDECAFHLLTINCPNDPTANNGGRTIVVRPPYASTWQNTIGQRDHLSTMDSLTMSLLYPEADWRFVDENYAGSQTGTFLAPYRQLATGITATPNGGTLWLQPGTYAAVGTYNKPMTLRAPLGNVQLGP